MNDYDFSLATTYINNKYNAVLRHIGDGNIKDIEERILLGKTFKELLPVTEETPLKQMLLLSLALDDYLDGMQLLSKAVSVSFQERHSHDYADIADDWERGKVLLAEHLATTGRTPSKKELSSLDSTVAYYRAKQDEKDLAATQHTSDS
jgi:hypothetical protein